MNWERELKLASDAVAAAIPHLKRRMQRNAGIQSVVGKDIKTLADIEAEQAILQALQPSNIPIIAEESSDANNSHDGLRWLVDPLDGTMNFSRGFPIYSVSIALWDGMQPILGVIADPINSKTYSGISGQGAYCNGQSIYVSKTSERSQAVLATGFPTHRDYTEKSLMSFIDRVQQYKKIRMIGSAAMSLAMVACGTFDAYYEEDIMIWDIAAGGAITLAAGGSFSVAPGSQPHSVIAHASNNRIPLS